MPQNIKLNYKHILTIGKNTFLETVRDKVLYSLIGFAILVIAASLFAASVSLGEDVRVIESFSLTSMRVFLLIITLFVGTQLVWREVEQKTIFLTLTKPVSRASFYLGKYLGICLTLMTSVLVMGLVLVVLLAIKNHHIPLTIFWAIACLLMESWLLVAISLLFSGFTSPVASAVYTFCLALIGHSANLLLGLAQKSGGFAHRLLEAVYYALPNLNKFDVTSELVYNIPPNWSEVGYVVLYFALYTALALVLGLMVFKDNEF